MSDSVLPTNPEQNFYKRWKRKRLDKKIHFHCLEMDKLSERITWAIKTYGKEIGSVMIRDEHNRLQKMVDQLERLKYRLKELS